MENIMIGDLVKLHCFDKSVITIKVTEIHENILYGKSSSGSHWGNKNDIGPIPITPDILEKNGFTLRYDGWIWCSEYDNEYQNYIFIQFRKGGEDGIGVRKCEINFLNKVQAMFRDIQYVHQLQQVLRICGIKKDIVIDDHENAD